MSTHALHIHLPTIVPATIENALGYNALLS
jgi:hypothetical protein